MQRTAVIGCALGMLTIVGVVVVWTTRPAKHTGKQPASILNPSSSSLKDDSASVSPESAEPIESQLGRVDPTLSIVDRKAATDLILSGLRVYSAGSVEDVREYMRAQGKPMLPWMNGDRAEDTWRNYSSNLRGASLLTERAQIEQVYKRGVSLQISRQPPPGRATMKAGRDSGSADIPDPVEAKLDAYEYRVPGVFSSMKGEPSQATFGLTVAKSPATGRWIVIGVALYDIPTGTPISPLPF